YVAGSVMLLFRGAFGCPLYTGDFRWEASNQRAEIGRNTLVKALKDDVVDILYLDNTYCSPSYAFLLKWEMKEIVQIVDIIASHPDHDIIIGIDSLGKEKLLFHISHKLNIKIWVWPERLQTMHLLGFHDTFTTKTSLARVRAVPRYSFSIDTLENLNTMHQTIGIMPSGLPWVVKPLKGGPALGSVDRFRKYIYSVPYSDQSCFAGIEEFLNRAQPSNIRGIVSSSSCYVDPLYYFGHLCRANQPSLRYKQQQRVQHKTVVAAQMKFIVESGRSTKVDRKRRTAEVGILGVRMSKVDALRRARRGAKLARSESSD
ncbi:hypothetical protein CICLE_v10018156mg, partial [Citrus x clementina]